MKVILELPWAENNSMLWVQPYTRPFNFEGKHVFGSLLHSKHPLFRIMVLDLCLLQVHRRMCIERKIKAEPVYFLGHNYVLFMEGRTYFVLGDLISAYIVNLPIWIVCIYWVKKTVEGKSNAEENRSAEADFSSG